MTAEEAKAKAEIVWNARWKGADERHIIDRIATAVRAAEADMRERCAKVADDSGAWLQGQPLGQAIRALE